MHRPVMNDISVQIDLGTPRGDPDCLNDKRAEWAQAAIREFQRVVGTDDEDALGDLLCDLMHYAVKHGDDFGLTLQRALYHYLAETGQEGPLSDG